MTALIPTIEPLVARLAAFTRDRRCKLLHVRDRLGGAEPIELPVVRPTPTTRSRRAARAHFEVPTEVALGLRDLCTKHDATMFMGLMSAFKVLLSRYGGMQDLAILTPVANRFHRDTRDLVGLFVNTIAVRTVVASTKPAPMNASGTTKAR